MHIIDLVFNCFDMKIDLIVIARRELVLKYFCRSIFKINLFSEIEIRNTYHVNITTEIQWQKIQLLKSDRRE